MRNTNVFPVGHNRYWQAGGTKGASQLLNPQYRGLQGTEEVWTPFSGSPFGGVTQEDRNVLDIALTNTIDVMRRAVSATITRIQLVSTADFLLKWVTGGLSAGFTTPDEARKNIINGLRSLYGIIDRMDASRTDVLTGKEDPKKWLQAANTVLEGVKQQADILNDYTFLNLVKAQLAETEHAVQDFINKLSGAGEKALSWLPWVLGGVAIVGAFVVYRAIRGPQVRVQLGSPPKRRRRLARGKKLSWWEPEMQLEGYHR